ncbi:MAG: RNA-binding protein [Chloroflexi bacterium]|nr:MAG: RNA-binding protein [Chloroflexota bacterium]
MNIYVGNLSFGVTEENLREEFMVFGEVKSVTIMDDKYIGSGQPRGYGFVEMTSKSEGTTAISNLVGKKLKGRVIDVVEALPLSDQRAMTFTNIRSNNRSNRSRRRK